MNGNFLQSKEWRKFQEATGRRTFFVSSENFSASVIEHKLPIIGRYFYVPKGPIFNLQFFPLRGISHSETISNKILNPNEKIPKYFQKLVNLAKENNIGWIRIEPSDSRVLDIIRENWRTTKAPHDMQPREILVVDITKTEEELLSEMKPKARYNIKLSQKHNVLVKVISNFQFLISNKIQNSNEENKKYIDEFLRLNKIMAHRQGIKTHSDEYYRKMFQTIPGEMIKLYMAEYENKIIAANIIIHYGETAIYLHGASDDKYKNLMAPYLLQWRAVCDAKKLGMKFYDFGGIRTKIFNFQFFPLRGISHSETISNKIPNSNDQNSKQKILNSKWSGITRFKMGFSPKTKPVEFPGSYDIVINHKKYFLYKIISRTRNFIGV